MTRRAMILLALGLLAGGNARAELVINEVMANEPGSATSLEWIELYNNAPVSLSLAHYSLLVDGSTTALPTQGIVGGFGYFIVCRRLYASASSDGFEGVWGDSSGVWGDTPFERTIPVPFETAFSLRNDGDTVVLLRSGQPLSTFFWTRSGADGVSWERMQVDGDSVAPCIASAGSSPGALNSISPVGDDLSIDLVTASIDLPALTRIEASITNRGDSLSVTRQLTLLDRADPLDWQVVSSLTLPEIEVGHTCVFSFVEELPGSYADLALALEPDDRPANDTFIFVAPGSLFPPLVLSEVQPDPEPALAVEWIELAATPTAEFPMSFAGWRLRDGSGSETILSTGEVASADQLAVVARDTALLATIVHSGSVVFVQTTSWPTLNNDGDIVYLIDPYGLVADSCAYGSLPGEHRPFARAPESTSDRHWYVAADPGGSPGRANTVVERPDDDGVALRLSSQYVLTDGSGEPSHIDIEPIAPSAESYSLRIFDRTGRVVRRFYVDAAYISPLERWDGRDDAGKQLPIGLYLVLFEAGGQATKRAVVVAR